MGQCSQTGQVKREEGPQAPCINEELKNLRGHESKAFEMHGRTAQHKEKEDRHPAKRAESARGEQREQREQKGKEDRNPANISEARKAVTKQPSVVQAQQENQCVMSTPV
jgi:ATP-dependent 26S proteasome regulatory subunit